MGPPIITNSEETHPKMPRQEHKPRPTSSMSSSFFNKISYLIFFTGDQNLYGGREAVSSNLSCFGVDWRTSFLVLSGALKP